MSLRLESISQDIRKTLLENHTQAQVSTDKKYIRKLTCPICHKNEAFAYYDKPFSIVCPRSNKCGSTTSIKEVLPQFFQNFTERFPTTKKDPKATARAYLVSRAIDPSNIEFKQGKVKEEKENKEYSTVKFEVDSKITFHRLIDYSGKNKTRIFGSYKGKVWKPKNFDYSKQTWVVEGILDALSLIQSGLQSIAILSSTHLPEEFYKKKSFLKTPIILGFDSDKAGKKAIEKHIRLFKEIDKKNYDVALPPGGRDWNDLLLNNAFSDERKENTLNNVLWRGRLHLASSEQKYFKIYCERHKESSAIFEYNHKLYRGFVKEKKDELEYSTYELADCSVDILYSIEDDSIQYNSRTKHRLKLYSPREGNNIVEFNSEELTQLQYFKTKFTNYMQTFSGSDKDLNELRKYLFNKKAPRIRQCHALGYDEKSNSYVFSKYLYDHQGKQFSLNEQGFFEKQKVTPFREKTIESFLEIDIKEFIQTLFDAHSYRGLLALGFWTASLFSHLIFKKYSFFPFLSLYGDPHCGKSDLTRLLNRCFFLDWEGINMSKANTQKGELRKMSQKCSLVTPMLEGRKDKTRFDYDSILGAYNRNAIQVRAKNTNGNETHELPFEGALVFVQNKEQFESKPAKERVVSIQFQESDLNDDTYNAWQKLSEYSLEQLAFVGHSILSKREFFEEHFIKEVQNLSTTLKKVQGIKIDRISKNHAIPYAGVRLVSEIFDINLSGSEILKYVTQTAKTKIETAKTTNLLAEDFFESLFSLKFKDSSDVGYIVRDNRLILHLPTVTKEIKNQNLGIWNKKDLVEALNEVAIEKRALRIGGFKKDCWIFSHQKN